MIGRRLALLCLAAALLFLTDAVRSEPASAPRKDRHALLVAVSYYENLPESKHLKGPANDVELVRKLLIEKLQFSPDQIVVLSEQAGKEKGKDFLPTRKNIQHEFARLARVARAGEQVLIHMGGHGSQQPEPDGLADIFLPRDAGRWNGPKNTVENAILATELGDWLTSIRAKNASVWVAYDSCHAAGATRGREVSRFIDLGQLNISPDAIATAVKKAAAREAKKTDAERSLEKPGPFKLARQNGLVAIYAADGRESTFEYPMPPGSEGGPVHGLLTYTMVMVLTEAMEKSKQPIAYAELARRIQARYVSWGRTFPTPLIEGDDRAHNVLDDRLWQSAAPILLFAKSDDLKINAGAVHGLTLGSILSVSRPGKDDQRLGFVRVSELRAFDAEVEACDKDGKAVRTEFVEGATCRKFFVDVGDQRLKVAVDPNDSSGKSIPTALLNRLAQSLKKLDGPAAVVFVVNDPTKANWLVQAWGTAGKEIVLAPAQGWSPELGAATNVAFGPVPVDDRLGDWLADALVRIARAESLKRLVSGSALEGGARGVKIKVEMFRRKDAMDMVGTIPLPWPGPSLPVHDGDLLMIRVSNSGRVPVDLTLLYIDSGYGIDCLLPGEGEKNRLEVGAVKTAKFLANSKTFGVEQLVVIADKGREVPVDFSALIQKTLPPARRNKPVALDQLFRKGLYGEGSARGMEVEEVDDHMMLLVPLHIKPEKRPPEPAK